MITAEMLHRLCPRARADYVDALVNGSETLERWGINTPLRMAALLGTALHETRDLTIIRENGNYSAERLVEVWPNWFTSKTAKAYSGSPEKLFNYIYGPQTKIGQRLGNVLPDDGFRFRGGGLGQTTGRYNYTKLGEAIGVDLANNPDQIEDAKVSLAGICWETAKFLKFCDLGARGWKAVCNGINRGNALSSLDPIGWSSRQVAYQKACDALGITGKVEDDLMRLGDRGELVKAMQERLAQLGYATGRADGIYGSRTRAAVLAFQAENGLTTDGLIGSETRTALNSEAAIPMPVGERATETAKDLREAGSETMTAAKAIKDSAVAVGGSSAVVGTATQVAPETPPADLIATTKDVATEISSWKTIVSLIGDTFAWATSHWWIFAIVLAFVLHRYGSKIEFRRLLDHTSGANLGR